MQTFLPFRDFAASAKVLDNKRLGNQRNECTVILKACLGGPQTPWFNHSCSRMWRGHEYSLVCYSNAILREWIGRGFKNSVSYSHFRQMIVERGNVNIREPDWLGDELLHASHRSALLRKKPEHYTSFGWTEPADLEMVWPVKL